MFPVADAFVMSQQVKHIPLAGRTITKFVMDFLKERKEPIPGGDIMEAARIIKEKYCYVCKDVVKEY